MINGLSENIILKNYVETLHALDSLVEEVEDCPESRCNILESDRRIEMLTDIREELVRHVKAYGVTEEILEKTHQRLHRY